MAVSRWCSDTPSPAEVGHFLLDSAGHTSSGIDAGSRRGRRLHRPASGPLGMDSFVGNRIRSTRSAASSAPAALALSIRRPRRYADLCVAAEGLEAHAAGAAAVQSAPDVPPAAGPTRQRHVAFQVAAEGVERQLAAGVAGDAQVDFAAEGIDVEFLTVGPLVRLHGDVAAEGLHLGALGGVLETNRAEKPPISCSPSTATTVTGALKVFTSRRVWIGTSMRMSASTTLLLSRSVVTVGVDDHLRRRGIDVEGVRPSCSAVARRTRG